MPTANATKPKILVVDDEPDALEVLAFKLKEAGYLPLLARDGARRATRLVNEPWCVGRAVQKGHGREELQREKGRHAGRARVE